MSVVKFKLQREGAQLPKQATDGSGAYDFFAPEAGHLFAGEKKLVPSGISHDLPGLLFIPMAKLPGDVGWDWLPVKLQGTLFDRSGLGAKKGIRLSFAGLIDNDYRGEIFLSIENDSKIPFEWAAGERLCQIAYVPMVSGAAAEVKEITQTERGAGGFGSTGK